MSTIINHPLSNTYTRIEKQPSIFTRFFNWCEEQEKNRFGWLAAALATHGCALTPITLFAIILSGNNIYFWVMAIAAMGIALVTNLAAMPTKITIPAFFLSILIDITLIIFCIAAGFNFNGTHI